VSFYPPSGLVVELELTQAVEDVSLLVETLLTPPLKIMSVESCVGVIESFQQLTTAEIWKILGIGQRH
jgi:hypothetical protein